MKKCGALKLHIGSFFFLLSLIVTNVFAQEQYDVTFRHYFIDQGLSNNSVRAILKDSKGFIWAGTEDGLNKFNGYNWTVYKNDPQDSSTISFGNITSLYEDKSGMIWIGIDGGGVNIFNPYTGDFKHFHHNPNNPNSLISENVKYIHEDRKGLFWIATWKGLSIYNPKTGNFKNYANTSDSGKIISTNDVKAIYEDSQGGMWLGTTNGLNLYTDSTNSFIQYYHNPADNNSLGNNDVMCITGDHENKDLIWIGTNGGMSSYDKVKKVFTNYKPSDNMDGGAINSNDVKVIYDDGTGRLWIGTFAGGLNQFDKGTKKFKYYRHNEYNHLSLSYNYVQSIIKDDEGLLWIGTRGGLNTLNTNVGYFKQYKSDPSKPSSISNSSVWSFYPNNEKEIWVGTNKGVNLFGKTDRAFKNSNTGHLPKELAEKDVKCIYPDKNNVLWIGTANGLFSYNLSDKKVTAYKDGISSGRIFCIFEDHDQTMWIGTIDGLFAFDRGRQKLTPYRIDTTSGNNVFYCGLEDKDNQLWFGAFGEGLFKFNKKSNSLVRVNNWPGKADRGYHYIIHLFADSNNKIWISTYGEGLYCYDKKSQKFNHYTVKDGLPSNVINAVIADSRNQFWISTNNGLSKMTFSGTKPVFRNYDKNDGLNSLEFNAGAVFRDKDDRVFFGAANGMVTFKADSIADNKKVPQVVLTEFKVLEQDFPMDTSITDKKKIVLNYDQNFFSFEFATLSYIVPENNQYAYKMEGIDTGWVKVNKRNYVSYTNLDPGTYIFSVKGCNSIGVWNEKGTSVTIVITPPFWKTPLFYVLVSLIALYGIVSFIRSREKRLKKKNEFHRINKKIAEFKLIALRSQMNSHFVFNALNSIQYFITTNNKEAAINYLSKFAKLIRQILENSVKTRILISDEVSFIKNYLEIESLRFENRLDYSIEIDEEIEEDSDEIPSMLIQPFVENSIIHGLMNKNGKGIIKIRIGIENNYITCIIEDNGVGRKEAAKIKDAKIITEHKSMGMDVTKGRLEVLNRDKKDKVSLQIDDLYNDDGTPSGTRVTIYVPIDY